MTLVLCYHAVSEDWDAALSVRPGEFERQLEILLDRGYEPATFSDAVTAPGRKRLAITFDDAFASVFELARPALERHGAVATVFVPTAYVGAKRMSWPGIEHWLETPHAPELAAMDADRLRELHRAGWEIGSHTRSHPKLTQLGELEALGELTSSRGELEDLLDGPCGSLAYPYGDHDDGVVDLAERAGYSWACTLPSRIRSPHPLAWPRIGIYNRDDERRFRSKINPVARALRASPLWAGLKAAQRLRGADDPPAPT